MGGKGRKRQCFEIRWEGFSFRQGSQCCLRKFWLNYEYIEEPDSGQQDSIPRESSLSIDIGGKMFEELHVGPIDVSVRIQQGQSWDSQDGP